MSITDLNLTHQEIELIMGDDWHDFDAVPELMHNNALYFALVKAKRVDDLRSV